MFKRQEREQAAGWSGFHLQCGQVTLEARERFGKETSYPPITSKLRYSRTMSSSVNCSWKGPSLIVQLAVTSGPRKPPRGHHLGCFLSYPHWS